MPVKSIRSDECVQVQVHDEWQTGQVGASCVRGGQHSKEACVRRRNTRTLGKMNVLKCKGDTCARVGTTACNVCKFHKNREEKA